MNVVSHWTNIYFCFTNSFLFYLFITNCLVFDRTTILSTFVIEFPLAYKTALIDAIKAEAEAEVEGAGESEKELDDAADSTYIIKEGKITKDGSTGGNWQERYLVAYNKSDNYCLRYFKGDNKDGVEKGKINTVGFYANHFDKEDKAKFESEGVKLCPYSSDDRYYHFKCASKEEANEWYSVLRTSCRYSEPPLDDNIVIAEAFKAALQATRWATPGVSGYSSCYYDECESLVKFIFDVIYDQILRDVINDIPDGMAKEKMTSTIKAAVKAPIKIAVAAAWTTLREAADGITNSIKDALKPALQPLIDAEIDLITTVSEKVEQTVGTALKGLGDKFLPDPARLLKNYAAKSVSAAAKGFSKKCKEILPELKGADKAKAIKLLEKMERQTWYHWSGCLRECYEEADKVYDALAGCVAFEGGMDRYDVYWIVRDNGVGLYRNATQTFFNKYFEALESGAADVDLDQMCTEVCVMCAHDVPLVVQDIFFATFTGLISKNEAWQTGIVEPMGKVVEPMQEVINKIPIVSDFINLQNILERTIDASLKAMVKPTIDETCAGAVDASALLTEM